MKVGIDIDGSADSAPKEFQSLMAALRAAGHKVVILTGVSSPKVTAQDVQEKENYLRELGLGESYDKLKVFSNPPSQAKAAYCAKHGIDILIDNNTKTARLADKYCVVLVPWATRDM